MQGAPSRAHENRGRDVEVSGSLLDWQPNATAPRVARMKSAAPSCALARTHALVLLLQMQWAQQWTHLPNCPPFPHISFVSHSHEMQKRQSVCCMGSKRPTITSSMGAGVSSAFVAPENLPNAPRAIPFLTCAATRGRSPMCDGCGYKRSWWAPWAGI